MIHNTFIHSFHSLIDPPNKDELLHALENAPLTKDQDFEWTLNCSVTTERLDLDLDVFFPSLDLFFKDLEANANLNISLHEVWRNTYSKGYFQELHDHLELDGRVDISGCIFLDDYHPECGRFYFRNRHASELSPSWKKILTKSNTEYVVYIPHYKRGDIIFFPADMLHGVYAHKSGKTRQTVSFNIGMNL